MVSFFVFQQHFNIILYELISLHSYHILYFVTHKSKKPKSICYCIFMKFITLIRMETAVEGKCGRGGFLIFFLILHTR